jgi:branched-subunit amino acid aminotransferase/4-amino-4-deoxychorismate lyase
MCATDEVLKLQQEIERLQKEIAELKLKIPSGVLQICSSCKKIKDPNGHWLPLDRFFTLYSNLETSHGYCDECAVRLIAEADE